jgi:hypothetical protein
LSSLDLLEDTAREEELAALSIRHGGEVKAAGYEQTARLDWRRADEARSKARFSAATSLLRGGMHVDATRRGYDILEA